MKFGLSFLPNADIKTPSQYYSDSFELSKIADQGGLDYIKMTEHYIHPYGGYCPSPLNFLSAVAIQTKKIRLMTGCILPVFHHPIQIAAECAMVDVISNGRLDVGFARAYLPYEFDAFQISLDESRERYEDTIGAVIKLWQDKTVTVNSKFFTLKEVNSLPIPIQKPHPPLWGAAVNSRQTFSWLGEQSFNLLVTPPLGNIDDLSDYINVYRECFLPSDYNAKPQVAISIPLFIDKNMNNAESACDKHIREYLKVWANAAEAWSNRASNNYPKYTGLGQILKKCSPQNMMKQKQVLVGTPEKIIEDIHYIKSSININTILWQIDCGNQPIEVSRNSLTLFIDKILPFI